MKTANPQEYRSLMLRKVQQVAQEHGGISNIPRELQKKLGFDVIAGRKGHSISVTIPEGDLSSKINALRSELPAAKAFGPSKPAPDPFGKYIPIPSAANPTMEDFWITQGWYKQGGIGIKLTPAKWKDDPKVQVEAVQFLVEKVLKKNPRDITAEDFKSNRLGGLLNKYYNGSPYGAFLEAGYAYSIQDSLQHAATGNFRIDKMYLWELSVTPNQFYQSSQNCIAATKWLVWKLKKDPRDITQEDFNSNRLGGLLNAYYRDSPYGAFLEAGYAYSIQDSLQHAATGNFQTNNFYPWEMDRTPMNFYESNENLVAATKWLVWKLQKDPRDIITEDFSSNGLWGVIKHYNGSPYAAFLEAGYQVHPWEMGVAPQRAYHSRENRIAAVNWLIEKLQKDPRDITVGDFYSNILWGLIAHHHNSPYEALLEAGQVTPADEAYMRRFNGARFSE